MRSWLKDFVHNCIVHPLLPFLPQDLGERLHAINTVWAYGGDQ